MPDRQRSREHTHAGCGGPSTPQLTHAHLSWAHATIRPPNLCPWRERDRRRSQDHRADQRPGP
eukprot:5869345-Pyramimonas_sp.AAC.1